MGVGATQFENIVHCPFLQDTRSQEKLWIFGRKVFIVQRVSCPRVLCSIDQHCTSWWRGLTQWAWKKGVTDVTQACNQSFAKTMGCANWRRQGAQYLTHIFFAHIWPREDRGRKESRELGALHHVVSSRWTKTGIWEAALSATCVSMRWGLHLSHS